MSSQLITIKEAATLFGASHQGIRAWIKSGAPASTEKATGRNGRPSIRIEPETFREWMIAKGVRTFLKSEVKREAEKVNGTPVSPIGEKPQMLPIGDKPAPAAEPTPQAKPVNVQPGVDGALDRLRAMELRAFSDYVKARNSGDVLAQRAHMKLHSEAVKRMLEAEEVADVRKLIEVEVWADVQKSLTAWSEPVKAMVEQMPRSLGSRCNVGDPAAAEAVLREWVVQQLFPMMGRAVKQ